MTEAEIIRPQIPNSQILCPACLSVDFETVQTAVGPRAYCLDCFHGWRTDQPAYAYTNIAMCSLGTNAERLRVQIDFFKRFAAPGARVLEIGCATGELAAAARATLSLGGYEGIELSPAGEHAARHLDRLYTAPLPELLAARAIEGPFDLIIMSHVLEHLADPAEEISALTKVLASTGAIFLEVPNRGGAKTLPIDDNRSHLHFFCANSLVRLLSRKGLEVVATTSGVRLDARYSDSLQIAATPFRCPAWSPTSLSDHAILAGEANLVVWGAGSLAEELLANFFDPAKIDFFVDKNRARVGARILGRPVLGPEALGPEPRTVLINSIDFADDIAEDIARLDHGVIHRLIRVGDLLE